MKYTFPYKSGDSITIYKDFENNKDPIGTAELVKLHALGRSFILKDDPTEKGQETFNYETWIVKWPTNNLTKQNIRYLDTVGIANSAPDDEDREWEQKISLLPKDKFLMVEGIEIY